MNSEFDREAVADIIRRRRTVEKFRDETPPREIIERAIELACWAPNHKHTEPWRFHLLGPLSSARLVELNTESVRQAKGNEAAAKKWEKWNSVPGWVALTSDTGDDVVRAEEDYAACCCAAQNFALALWSEGIGVKWSTGAVTRTPDFARLLGFEPGQRKIVGLFSYGYPAVVPESRRRPVSEVIDECP